MAGLNVLDAAAEVPLTGYFIARDSCLVAQSIRLQTNPGNVRTELSRAYDLHSKNAEVATHYLIEIPGAQPSRRWVPVACGQHVVLAIEPSPKQNGGNSGSEGESYVLAVSWQPGFCETKPQKPECVSMTTDRFDASNFSLHGLWPQPRSNIYCNVEPAQVALDKAGRWDDLDALDLSIETRGSLEITMPGTESALHRHEWTKHGSCYEGGSAEKYFEDSLALLVILNASGVQDLFETNIGQQLETNSIRNAFNAAFGQGAGNRVEVNCRKDGSRELITELQLQIRGEITDTPNLGELLLAASPVRTRCDKGIVDPVGTQ